MGDQDSTTTTSTGPAGGVTADQVRTMIGEVMGDLFRSGKADIRDSRDSGGSGAGGSGGSGPASTLAGGSSSAGPDIGTQVRAEVEKIRQADAAERERRGLRETVDQLKEVVERPPREYNRLTTWLWGEPDDE